MSEPVWPNTSIRYYPGHAVFDNYYHLPSPYGNGSLSTDFSTRVNGHDEFSAIAVVLGWGDICTGDGTFDFGAIESLLSIVSGTSKKVGLYVTYKQLPDGRAIPSYLKTKTGADGGQVYYGGGTTLYTAKICNSVVRTDYKALITALSSYVSPSSGVAYADDSRFAWIDFAAEYDTGWKIGSESYTDWSADNYVTALTDIQSHARTKFPNTMILAQMNNNILKNSSGQTINQATIANAVSNILALSGPDLYPYHSIDWVSGTYDLMYQYQGTLPIIMGAQGPTLGKNIDYSSGAIGSYYPDSDYTGSSETNDFTHGIKFAAHFIQADGLIFAHQPYTSDSAYDSGSGIIPLLETYGPNGSDILPYTAAVSAGTNNPPSITNPGEQTVTVGNSVDLTITGSDPDAGDSIDSWSAPILPSTAYSSASFNTGTQNLTWTPTLDDVADNPYQVTIKATDTNGASTLMSFGIRVIAPTSSVYTDDFETDTTGDWTAVNGGSVVWSTSRAWSGTYSAKFTTNSAKGMYVSIGGTFAFADNPVVTARVNMNDTSVSGAIFGIVNSSGSGYAAMIDENGQNLKLRYLTSNVLSGSPLASVSFTNSVNTWYLLELRLNYDDSNGIEVNVYDETTTSGGSFTTGHTYRIASIGTTDFTAIGASSNSVGTIFTSTGAGSGTGTAYEQLATTNATDTTTTTGLVNYNVSDGGVNYFDDLDVQTANHPPTLDTIPDGTTVEGVGDSIPIHAYDADSDTITLAASGTLISSGIGVLTDNGDGTGYITITSTDGDAASYSCTVTADDGIVGTPTSVSFTYDVTTSADPVLASIGAQSATEGQQLSVDISATTTNVGDNLVITTSSLTGDLSNAQIVDNGDGTATFTWTPPINANASSPFSVTFTVTNSAGLTDAEIVSITVSAGTSYSVSANITDDFSSDSGLWDTFNSVGESEATVTLGSGKMTISKAGSTGGVAGLVSKKRYSISAIASVLAEVLTAIPSSGQFWVMISPTKVALSGADPWDMDDWYRVGFNWGTNKIEKSVSGDKVTVLTGASASTVDYQMDFPDQGDEVRFLVNSSEIYSISSYEFSSKNVYIYVYAKAVSATDYIFDNFAAEAAAIQLSGSLPTLGVGR